MKRLGSVSDAREALDLPDAAAVWDAVAAGTLVAERPTPLDPWVIYES